MALKFGTSGVRGLVTEMTDLECYLYTRAFIQYVRSRVETNVVSVAGDFRSSTPRIKRAISAALQGEGIEVDDCGSISTSAVTYHAMLHNQPSIMVTGSHIPDDRNGIKFSMPWGEILKKDEEKISENYEQIRGSVLATPLSFSESGELETSVAPPMSKVNRQAEEEYARRYLDFFSQDCLSGLRVVVYEHSSVSRDLLSRILRGLGAEVITVGRSDVFVPVDTEAVTNPEELATWTKVNNADALVSTDGDGDRPLVCNEKGAQIRGDILGLLSAEFLGADSVSVPVSCSSSIEKSRFFRHVARTRIGSPFVISSMLEAVREGFCTVVGFEANGGFLTASNIAGPHNDRPLLALPTRDAILPILTVLRRSVLHQKSLFQQSLDLPATYNSSGLIRQFPNDQGHAIVENLKKQKHRLVARYFGEIFGNLESLDFTDGARMVFTTGDIVHLRPSGNAPEFRCYTEAKTQQAADENSRRALEIVRTMILPQMTPKEE